MDHTEFRKNFFEYGRLMKSCMANIIEPLIQSEGLTALQAMILIGIKCDTINNVSSLNKQLGMGQANASTICKKLEKLGFLCRARNKKDERVVTLYLTPKGELALKKLEEKSASFNPILKTVSPEKFELIINGFIAMNEVLSLIQNSDTLKKEVN